MKSKVWRSIFFYIWNASIKTFFSLSLIKKSHFTLKGKQKKYNQIKGRFLKKLELKLKVNLFYRNICKNAFFFFFLEHHKKVHCPPSIIHTKILFPTPLGYARIALHEGRASHSNVQTSSVKPKVFMNRVFWLFLSVLGSSVSTSYVKVFKVPNN